MDKSFLDDRDLPSEDRSKEAGKDKFGAPDYIYLQLHGDDDPDLVDEPFVDCTDDISWCWEMIYEFDVEYIRIDLHKNKIDSLTKERDELKDDVSRLAGMLREREGNMDGLVQKLRKMLYKSESQNADLKQKLEATQKQIQSYVEGS